MALMRAILRRARDEWEWIDKAPKVKMYREVRRYKHSGPAQMSRHAEVVRAILKATNLTQTVEAAEKTKGSATSQPFDLET